MFAATATALKKFSGPSAESAVAGRIEPVRTIGLAVLATRFRKYAVSSMVSVPCVMTMPSTSAIAPSSLTRLASFSHTSSFMSCDPMLEICSPLSIASFFACGTALINCSTPSWPDV